MVSLEEQIDRWRSYFRHRQAIHSVDVAELEDHLREQVAILIEAGLDADESASARYVLEVSSPGAERPLRTPAEWRRFVGKSAVVTAQPLPGGKAEVTVLAVEGEPGAEVAVVRDAKGVEHRLSLADVTDARLAFHWNKSKE